MISFIVPTLNEESVIERIIKCLSGYSGDKEIIVSDGRSSDKTVEIAKRLGAKVVIEEGTKVRNIASGRNWGAKHASGDFLVFIDADVFIPDINRFFSKALKIFEVRKKLVAMTVKIKVFPKMATLPDKMVFGYMNFFHFMVNNVFCYGVSPGEFQMMRRQVFDKVGGFNERLAASEDYDMFMRISKIGRTRFEKELTVYHTGRRAHTIGWPRLLTKWFLNSFYMFFFDRSFDYKWREIR
ncbi:MAG: glycosyltransferase [Candidatus Paceibacterota bacterium]|jgi:glycosyltransferase involved in cell wall biosynthesis